MRTDWWTARNGNRIPITSSYAFPPNYWLWVSGLTNGLAAIYGRQKCK